MNEIIFQNMTDTTILMEYEPLLPLLLERTLTKTNNEKQVEVGIVVVDSTKIHEYNKTYRNIDRPTDVLSFEDGDIVDGVCYIGDIIINVEAVVNQAKEYNHSIKREFCFLVVHGYLHLLGYDHQTPQEEEEMICLQKEILDEVVKRSDDKELV